MGIGYIPRTSATPEPPAGYEYEETISVQPVDFEESPEQEPADAPAEKAPEAADPFSASQAAADDDPCGVLTLEIFKTRSVLNPHVLQEIKQDAQLDQAHCKTLSPERQAFFKMSTLALIEVESRPAMPPSPSPSHSREQAVAKPPSATPQTPLAPNISRHYAYIIGSSGPFKSVAQIVDAYFCGRYGQADRAYWTSLVLNLNNLHNARAILPVGTVVRFPDIDPIRPACGPGEQSEDWGRFEQKN